MASARVRDPVASGDRRRPAVRPGDLPWAAWRLARKLAFHVPSIRSHIRIAALSGRLGAGPAGEHDAIRDNLRTTFADSAGIPDLDTVIHRTCEFAAVARLAGIMPRLRGFRDPDRWQIAGREYLDAALAEGRGAILVTAHFGFGLLLGSILRLHGLPAVQVMVEYVHRAERERRAKWGVDGSRFRRWIYERTRVVAELLGPEDVVAGLDVRPIFRALAANRPVLLAGDGQRSARFLEMPILGQRYPLAPGFAEIALRAGCPVLPVFAVEGTRRQPVRVEIGPPLPLDPTASVEANLATYARVLDARLREAPHLWHLWVRPRLFESTRVWSGGDLADRYTRDWRDPA